MTFWRCGVVIVLCCFCAGLLLSFFCWPKNPRNPFGTKMGRNYYRHPWQDSSWFPRLCSTRRPGAPREEGWGASLALRPWGGAHNRAGVCALAQASATDIFVCMLGIRSFKRQESVCSDDAWMHVDAGVLPFSAEMIGLRWCYAIRLFDFIVGYKKPEIERFRPMHKTRVCRILPWKDIYNKYIA